MSGYASLSATPYDMGSYEEQISPGAFASLSSRPDVQLLVNHEGLPLARTTNGSLMLREDDKGLRFDAQLDRDDPMLSWSIARSPRAFWISAASPSE